MASTPFVGQEDIRIADDASRLYRLFADTIPHMVWTARADGATDYFNERCHQYTGLDSDQLAGWGWKDVVHPDDREHCLATWARSLQSGERYEVEYRLRRADGTYRWHHGTALPQRGPDGHVTRWFGTCTDIEDQIRSAHALEALVEKRTRALHESEQRFQQFLEHLPASAWIRDAQMRYTYANRLYARQWGIEPATLLGRRPEDLFPPEVSRAFRDSERKVQASRTPLQFYDNLPSGHWLKVKFPLPDGEGGYSVGGIAFDITERTRLEEALGETERRFQLFMENLPAYAWIIDSQSRYTYVNRTYARSFGREPHEMLGQDSALFFTPEVIGRYREVDRKVKRGGVPIQYLDDAPEGGKWLKIKFPFTGPGGDLGIGGIALDVTDRLRLQQRLMATQESERRRLADNLHDLIGQNLTALGIELGALKARLEPEVREVVAARLEAMSGLLNDTVDSIRGVMTELRPPALEEYGLVPAVRWYAAVFGERTGMKVTANVSAKGPRLPRDAELALFRILQEALTNSAKHSGGTSVEIVVTEYAGGIRLSVEDDGRGFADPVGARSEQRGGWGLPAMRERAEAHGGRLRIEFPSRGTRVVVEIPQARDH